MRQILVTIATLAFTISPGLLSSPVYALAPVYAPLGCAMAHCDPQMSDQDFVAPPLTSTVVQAWHDTTVAGSNMGIGCSSNTKTVVCSFQKDSSHPASLRAYNPAGQTLWTSTSLSNYAWTSAPIIDDAGNVIAADNSKLWKYNANGTLAWSTSMPGGIPISPTVTENGTIFSAALGGPLADFDASTGKLLAQLKLNTTINYKGSNYSGYFDTVNTPGLKNNRAYVVTQFKYFFGLASLPVGRLYAIDINRNPTTGAVTLTTAWYYQFKAPSGGSPLVINNGAGSYVYFDGTGLDPTAPDAPQSLAVKDLGSTYQFLWNHPMLSKPEISPARDPRGGIWTFAPYDSHLLRLDENDGHTLQDINLEFMVDPNLQHGPASIISVTNSPASPAAILSASTSTYSSIYVVALDLNSGNLIWKYKVDEGKGQNGVPNGQYPIVTNTSTGKPVVVFTSYKNGIWALTTP